METIVGLVRNIIYESPQNDFKVFVLTKSDKHGIRVTGDFPQILCGAKIELHGKFVTHQKYGIAFKADAHSFNYDENPRSIALYIQSIAKWVGPHRSFAIAEKFGSDLQKVIEQTPERLAEIEGIGLKVAESIADAWALNRNMRDIQIFLHNMGLSVLKIRRIITMFGSETEKILTENPWLLCQHGFGFTTCDYIAVKLKKNMQDPFRFQQFIIYSLNQVSNSGHLFLFPEQLLDAFNKYNKKAEYPFQGNELTLQDIAPYVKALVQNATVINDQNRFYELSSFFYENESARLIYKIFETKSTCKLDPSEAKDFIKKYEKSNSVYQSEPFILSEAQADAIRSFFKEKVMIITGFPGSGKTTLLKAFVQILKERSISFELMTPTGIAAKKLGNTAEHEANTIHRRLGYKGDSWDYNTTNKYDTDVVIVDECSMVDQEVFYRLISALYSSTKIVFVGDNDQLPSVGPGCVLKELIESKLFKTIFLNKIFRQEDCSEIILEAKKIRDGNTDLDFFRSNPKADIWHIADREEKRIEALIVKFAQQLKSRAKEKKSLTFQIITPRNEGPLSVFSLNMALQNTLNPPDPEKKELKIDKLSVIRIGDRVIVKKNNYLLEVFNGDVGKVIIITPYSVIVDIDDFFNTTKRVEFSIKQAEEMLKLAYCLTVHKCVPKGTLIYTGRGILPIESVYIGDVVYTHKNRYRTVSWLGATGRKLGVSFVTRTGSEFSLSPEHRLLVSNLDNTPMFKKAENISIGDYVCTPQLIVEGIDIPLPSISDTKNNRMLVTIPNTLNSDFSWLLGALIGDDCYTNKKDGMIEFGGPTKIVLLDNFKDLMSSYGLNVGEHKRGGKRYSVYTISKSFRDIILNLGLGYTKARDKNVPEIFFRCKIKEKVAFIAGLFDTDGSVNKKGFIRYRTASKELAVGIKCLLHSLGITSFLKKEREYSYLISIFGVDTIKFRELIPLKHPQKKKLLQEYKISYNSKSNHYDIPYGKLIVSQYIKCFLNNEGKTRGLKGKGFSSKYPVEYKKCTLVLRGKNKFRYPLLRDLMDISENEGFELPNVMRECIENNYYFDLVIQKDTVQDAIEMYDMEVEEDHSYSTPNYLCHNCQGSEYSIVILPLIKAHGAMLLQRNLLYTAITRAKKKVMLIGQTSAIEQSIKNNKIQKRNTLLAERINQWTQGTGISLYDMFSRSQAFQNNKNLKQLLSLEEGSN